MIGATRLPCQLRGGYHFCLPRQARSLVRRVTRHYASGAGAARGSVTTKALFSLFARMSSTADRDYASLAEEKWWKPGDSVAVVTGANKGIGYACARLLAKEGLKTVVTARKEDLGKAAAAEIKESTGNPAVLFHRLDIADPKSVREFAAWAQADLGHIDVLINNAGVAYKGSAFGPKEAQETLDTNFAGTRAVCEALDPLLRAGSRVVNVCSMAGKLSILKSAALRHEFESASEPDQVATLAARFVNDVAQGRHAQAGWPNSMYGVSKVCEAMYTRVLADQLSGRGVTVSACCPGYVDTDMTSHRGWKTITQGADTPVWLALAAPKGATGKFWSDCREQPY